MASQRILTIAGHVGARNFSAGIHTTAAKEDYVPQYTNAEHPVLKCRRRVNILDSYITYIDTEVGDHVVVFLHGNPSSSYLWRNVILQVRGTARCIAPDLIGHGLSGKEPNNQYRVEDHYKYLNAWIDTLKLPEKFTFVVHDWGAGVGLHWANKNRHRIESLIYFEAALAVAPGWERMTQRQQDVYRMLRSPKAEEFMNNPHNSMMDGITTATSIMRTLRPEEEVMWKAPFEKTGECRRPIVTWCREVPVKGDGPDDVIELFQSFRKWLSADESIPKLYIDIEPGMLAPNNRLVTKKWHNQKVTKARGLHFAQEDDPVTIGNSIATFLKENVYN